jgi:tetratricopeptide (TPR) repeat protein
LGLDREDRIFNKAQVLIIAAKISLNHLFLYKEALEFAKFALLHKEKFDERSGMQISTIYYVLGICSSKYGDVQNYYCEKESLKKDALKYFLKCSDSNPDNFLNLCCLAREFAEIYQPNEAIIYIKKALSIKKYKILFFLHFCLETIPLPFFCILPFYRC